MKQMLYSLAIEDDGQTIMEYALIVTFLLFAIIGVAAGYHQSIGGVTSMTNQNLASASAFVR
jgi:Flp pilus assembly pilin Flp